MEIEVEVTERKGTRRGLRERRKIRSGRRLLPLFWTMTMMMMVMIQSRPWKRGGMG